jgi:hypothetical protein
MSEGPKFFTDGFQHYNLYRNNMPEHLSELNSFFEEHADTVRMAKKSFREQVAAKANTLSPKDAFDLRLRCLDFLVTHFGPSSVYDLVKPNVYEYYIGSEGLFRVEDEDYYESFLKEDDRYEVEFGDWEWTDKDSCGFAVHLTILDKEGNEND